MNYHIFIDETGNFSKKTSLHRDTDFVGGWCCEEMTYFRLKSQLNKIVNPFNDNIEKTKGSLKLT